ncbi:YcdB/YcdC domain-containing protein [Brevibacillus sp. NRS-1366]|uniref:YcdB/YcdC domain-containing protein n=1 Tax=Brevibacillus sp. NRS-1366 TaxID=3233899 RepID=UPI003D220E82
MKPWFVRSSSVLLTASLLLPVAHAHAQMPSASVSKAVSGSAQGSTTVLAVASTAKLSKEAALAIASKLVPTSGLELTNVSLRSSDSWRTFPEWSFSWSKKDANTEEIKLSYSVNIHGNTGELTNYSRYEPGASNLPYAKRISYEDAKTQAERFLEKNNADKAAQTRLYLRDMPAPKTPLNNDISYTFRFVRSVDGVLFPDNGADITVNSAGTVTNYSLSWNDVKFEKSSDPISKEEAGDKLLELSGASLYYLLPWERAGADRNKPILGYMNPFTFYLDATDGKALNQSLAPRGDLNEPVAVSKKQLPARHSGKALSQDEAAKIASQLFDLSKYELRSANYSEKDYQGNRSVWNLEYVEKSNSNTRYAYVSIDAVTGDVYSYNKDQPIVKENEKSAKKQNPENLKEKAMETIRKWTPTTANQLFLTDRSTEEGELPDSDRYSISFARYVNGIAAASGSAYFTFDAQSGEILSYSTDFGNETYPAELPKHLSAEEAVEAWWKESEIEAIYMMTPLSPEDKKKLQQQPSYIPQRTAKLVYRVTSTPMDQPYFFDATTGDWRSLSSGKTINLHRPAPDDLKGHPAEKELLLMYEYDALSLEDGKIMPQKQITRGEMIEMLMISLNQGRHYPMYAAERKATYSDVANGSRYFSAVEAAVDRGLLDKNASKLNPDEAINREELADMIVRALGYNKLADYSGMFQSQLTDIANTKHRGSIVIATTLGIVPTDKQKFQPQAIVSRADAAITFTRFLEKRGEQDTQPILYRE